MTLADPTARIPVSSGSTADATHLLRWRPALAYVVVFLAFILLRIPFLGADPPHVLPWGESVWGELFAEPAAKAYEARNFALFGEFNTHPADDYRFWRIQAPVWVYGLAGWFDLWGVGYHSLRAFSILFASLGVIGLAMVGARVAGAWGVLIAGACYVFEFYPLHASRVGLIEPSLNALLLMAFALLVRSWIDLRYFYLVVLFFLAAFLTKQSAVVFLPALLVGGWWAVGAEVRRAGWSRVRPLLVCCALVCVAVLVYVMQPEYQEKILWNSAHLVTGHDPQSIEQLRNDGMLRGAGFHPARLLRPWRIMPGVAVLAGIGLAWAIVVPRERVRREPTLVMAAIWLLCAVLPLMMVGKDARRYDLLVHAPVVVIAVLTAVKLCARGRWAMVLTVSFLAMVCCLGVSYQYRWAATTRYTIADFEDMLHGEIGGREAVFVGQWATPLVLGTTYRSFYVKAVFNTRAETLEKLGITHALLMREEHTGRRLKQVLPTSFARMEFVRQGVVGHTPINLFRWRPPSQADLLKRREEPGAR